MGDLTLDDGGSDHMQLGIIASIDHAVKEVSVVSRLGAENETIAEVLKVLDMRLSRSASKYPPRKTPRFHSRRELLP